MLVGDVANRTAILIDDLADTSNTITRAAKLLKKEGAVKVYALITHGVLSGDAIDRINGSAIDKLIVTNSVPQEEHQKKCPKMEVLDVGHIFAEVRDEKLMLFDKLTIATGDSTGSPRREHQRALSIRLTAGGTPMRTNKGSLFASSQNSWKSVVISTDRQSCLTKCWTEH